MDADVNKILFVTGGYDSTIKLWRPHIGTIVKSFQHPDSPVNCLCISPFKKCIYSGGFQKIRKYDKETSSLPICVYDNFQKNITSMKINSDEKWLLSSGEDGCLRIWDLRYCACLIIELINLPKSNMNLNLHKILVAYIQMI
uniref:Target of rapamycin complex subunit lst8 n=1 Tax=Henneguya salminicola TaxID=69463 RepID=A0A6G3MKP5_HENSL